MSKLTIQNMSFYYTDFYHPVFQNVNLVLDTDWKLGLIGRNGRGKTTFLRLLDQTLQPSEGRIDTYAEMCYFPYELETPYLNGRNSLNWRQRQSWREKSAIWSGNRKKSRYGWKWEINKNILINPTTGPTEIKRMLDRNVGGRYGF